jgi:hypothetical protein
MSAVSLTKFPVAAFIFYEENGQFRCPGLVAHFILYLLDSRRDRVGLLGTAAATVADRLRGPGEGRAVPVQLAYEPAIQRAEELDQLDATSGLHIMEEQKTLFGIRRRSLLVGGLFTLAFIHLAYCFYRTYSSRQVR